MNHMITLESIEFSFIDIIAVIGSIVDGIVHIYTVY